jgi:hypothetical protein
MTIVVMCKEFIDDLTDKIWTTFRPHSFVAQHQAKVLTQSKQSLNEYECVVLVDFAENYSFVVQDAVQGCHLSNDQVTLHPVVIYMHQSKSPSKPKPVSLCIVSDYMTHITSTCLLEGCGSVYQDTG